MRNGLPFQALVALASLTAAFPAAALDFSSSQPIFIVNSGNGGTPEVATNANTAIVAFADCQLTTAYCPATVYTRSNGLWIEAAQLNPAATEVPPKVFLVGGDLTFGYGAGVAVSSDGNTVFVGDPQNSVVDVYTKPAGGWQNATPTAQLTVSGSSFLGGRLLVSGSTLFATGITPCGATSCVTVLVFTEPAGGWKATPPAAELQGTASAFGFDGNGALAYDASTSTLAVCFGASQVWVFQGSSGTFTSGSATAELTSSDAGGGNLIRMGSALAIAGGVVVAGGPGSSGNQGGIGLVWVEPAGGWADMTIENAVLGPVSTDPHVALQLGTGTFIDGSGTVYLSTVAGDLYVYPVPAGGWASEKESSQISLSATPDPLAGGPMFPFGSSAVQQASGCDGGADVCTVARIYPAPSNNHPGSATMLSSGAITVTNAQNVSSGPQVVLAGQTVNLDVEIDNLGQESSGTTTLSFTQPAGSRDIRTDEGPCPSAASTITCPAVEVGSDTSAITSISFVAPTKRRSFTLTMTLHTPAGSNWDPLDDTASDQIISDNPPVAPDNYSVAYRGGASVSGTIPATDPDGDKLTFTIYSEPRAGDVVLSSDGQFSYTPTSPNFTGPDSFLYTVSDGLLSVQGTVTITAGAASSGGSGGGGGSFGLLLLGTLLLFWPRRIAGRSRGRLRQ